MIFFIVNNDFHLDLDNRLASQLTGYKLGLIQVPYSLNVIEKHPSFSIIHCFDHKLHASLFRFLLYPREIQRVKKRVNEAIQISRDDILLVHNEIDLTNQYIIQRFADKKARIFLLEDGTSTMCTYNLKPEKAPIKERLKFWIIRKFYNFKYTRVYKYGAQVLPAMEDHLFDGLIVNYGESVLRKIKVYKLRQPEQYMENLDDNCATFFSQPLYFWYMSEEEYVTLIESVFEISENFRVLYFKFHPSDKISVQYKIKNLITKRTNIKLIEENDIAEVLIEKYPAKYAVTFNSTAALNLIAKGVVPVFLNNLVSSKHPSPSLLQFDSFLSAIKCKTPTEIPQIKPGFYAFAENSSAHGKTISDIIF